MDSRRAGVCPELTLFSDNIITLQCCSLHQHRLPFPRQWTGPVTFHLKCNFNCVGVLCVLAAAHLHAVAIRPLEFCLSAYVKSTTFDGGGVSQKTDRLALPRGTWGKMHGRHWNTEITGNAPLLPLRTFASAWKMNPVHCADTGQFLHFNWVSNQWETSHRYVCMHMLECVYWLSS